jgi:hypothetical protein
MESRTSTRLGENVRLLTFVSVFFLPLGLCVVSPPIQSIISFPPFPLSLTIGLLTVPHKAIWSINESYSRTAHAITTVLVAAATYFITLNLNNLARGLRKVWAPRRRRLIEQMTMVFSPRWDALGARFIAFQSSRDHSSGRMRKPSEWMIVVFLGRLVVVGLGRGVKAGFGFMAGLRRRRETSPTP